MKFIIILIKIIVKINNKKKFIENYKKILIMLFSSSATFGK